MTSERTNLVYPSLVCSFNCVLANRNWIDIIVSYILSIQRAINIGEQYTMGQSDETNNVLLRYKIVRPNGYISSK